MFMGNNDNQHMDGTGIYLPYIFHVKKTNQIM